MKKRSKRETHSYSMEAKVQEFFDLPLAQEAARPLSDRALVALHVEGDKFFFRREKGGNTLLKTEEVAGEKVDLQFWVPAAALERLLDLGKQKETGMAKMGMSVIETIITNDESRKIKFRLDVGFLTLWSKGYFSILKAGGPELSRFLAKLGFDSISKIKDLVKQLRK